MSTDTETRKDAAEVGVLLFESPDMEEWHFQSRDNPNIFWTVHLSHYDRSGECTCWPFIKTIRPLLEAKIIKPHSERSKCKHIRRAEKILNYRVKKRLFPAR